MEELVTFLANLDINESDATRIFNYLDEEKKGGIKFLAFQEKLQFAARASRGRPATVRTQLVVLQRTIGIRLSTKVEIRQTGMSLRTLAPSR